MHEKLHVIMPVFIVIRTFILSLCKTERMLKYCSFISAALHLDKKSMQNLSSLFSKSILLCKILMFLLLNVLSKLLDGKME